MTAGYGSIQHEKALCKPDVCPDRGCWCAACERGIHGEAAFAWMHQRMAESARRWEAVERIRAHHDRTLGHAWTNRIGYCADPDGISATYCETGILLSVIPSTVVVGTGRRGA